MPTTFANTINGNEILAKRSLCDYAGADIQTTYATKSEVTTGLADKENTVSDLAQIRQGAAAGATAVQPGDLAAVATTGAYSDLTGAPTIPTATSDLNNDSGFITLSDVPAQVNADWNSSSGASEILNKPTIPNATSDLTNDSGFITLSDVPAQVNADWNAVSGAAEILNKPTIPAAQVNSDWNASSGVAEILNKPTILPYKPVVAGTGVRIVDDTANNRIVVEADETVLWENSSGEVIGANQYITLSESLKNFERVIVYYVLQPSWGSKLTYELVGVNGNVPFCLNQVWYREQSGYNNYWETITFNKYDDTTLRITNIGGEQGPIHSTSWTTTSGLTVTMYKVVGINRVASN